MSVAECYVLDVQCDNRAHLLPVRGEFTGKNSREAHKHAREAGWIINKRDWTALCKRCAGPMKGTPS